MKALAVSRLACCECSVIIANVRISGATAADPGRMKKITMHLKNAYRLQSSTQEQSARSGLNSVNGSLGNFLELPPSFQEKPSGAAHLFPHHMREALVDVEWILGAFPRAH